MKVKTNFKPHPGQRKILQKSGKFNVVRWGRRGGKTSLAEYQLHDKALITGRPTAWFTPTYKDLKEVWDRSKKILAPLISKTDGFPEMAIHLVNGAKIDFWSMTRPGAGRGRKYARAIIDEAAKKKKGLIDELQKSIMPTLVDYDGDLYVYSTPAGFDNDFYLLHGQNYKEDFTYFKMPSTVNPGLKQSVIDHFKRILTPTAFAQEFLAEFVSESEVMFFYDFPQNPVIQELSIDTSYPLDISFDFNYNPCTAIVGQKLDRTCVFLDLIQVNGGTQRLCNEILSRYGPHVQSITVTGDASGRARSSKSQKTDYDIIRDSLKLSLFQMKARKANLNHIASRTVCNYFFSNVDCRFNEGLEDLINESRIALPDRHGKLYKDENTYVMHAVDALRYLIDHWFPTTNKITGASRIQKYIS